jgi:hypothetical protein
MPTLALNTLVHDPQTGRTVVLHRGTDVQGRVLTLITNPGVWEDADEAAEARAAFEASQATATELVEPQQSLVEPPRTGTGSGRDSWAAFAEARGVAVSDEDKRDDIIAALAEAGVIDE